jgi:hypothetical protein
MKLEKLKSTEIKKNEMSRIKGGLSNTSYYPGIQEQEYEVDKDGNTIGKKIIINF